MALGGLMTPGLAQDAGALQGDASAPLCRYPQVNTAGVHTRPTLAWSPVAGARAYIIECAGDSLFSGIVARDTADAEAVTRLRTQLPYAAEISWRVAALDTLRQPVWSRSSTLATAPPLYSSPVFFPPTRRNDTAQSILWLRIPVRNGITIEEVRCGTSTITPHTSVPWITGERDSIPIPLSFRPRRFGSAVDTVIVRSDHGECRIAVAGDSPAPELRAVAPASDFGPVARLDTGVIRVALRNVTGINDAVVKRVRTRTPFFSVVAGAMRPIPPAESVAVAVRFHPRLPGGEIFGPFSDTLLVEYDGGEARVTLMGDCPPPRPLPDVAAIDFGEVAAQDTGIATVRIANGSINELRIDSVRTRIRMFGAMRGRSTVRRSDTLDLPVRFSSGRHGWFRDTLVVYNNSWRGPVRIPMRAYVPFPRAEASTERLEFGVVSVADTTSAEVRIGNASPSYLRVDSIRTRSRSFPLVAPQLPFVVTRGDSMRIRVRFRPDSVGAYSDTLLVITNGEERVLRIPISGSGSPAGEGSRDGGPAGTFALYQNFPNPFSLSTTFRFALPVQSRVRLEVYTTIGQSVALILDGVRDAGFHDVVWNADVPSGMYYCRLSAAPLMDPGRTFVGTRKIVVVR